MLTYVLKNRNVSNGSRFSKWDAKSFSSQYVLDGSIQNTCNLVHHYLKKRQMEDSEICEGFCNTFKVVQECLFSSK